MGESQLQGTKEAHRARHCQSHELELSQHMLPFLHTDSVSASQILEDVNDPLRALLHQLQCHAFTIQDPPQDFIPLVPAAVSLCEFLFRYGFLSMHGVCISLSEDIIHGMHDAPPNVMAPVPGPLSEPNEVIDKHIDVSDWPQKDQEGGTVSQLWQRSQSG